ncbi:MAG: APC family permease [Candidatus Promineifilaceae bacterium]
MAQDKRSSTKKDQVSLAGALSIGIGGMVGGGIFAVLGLAATLGGGATPIAFLIAGIVALLTAYSYAKLSVTFPSRGGTVIFIDKAFGRSFLTGSANNLLWISYIVALALYAVAFGNYAATFFGSQTGPILLHALISAGIVIPALLNLLSAELVSKTEAFVVLVKLAILTAVIVFGIRGINTANLGPANWEPLPQIIAAGMLIFIAYEGFELIANAAEDVKDLERTLPRAFYGSVISVIVLYVLIAIVTVGTLSPPQIQQAADYALAQAAKPSLGQVGFTLVAVSAVLATFSAINATLYGSARLSYVIAKEGELPAVIERKVWNQPIGGLLITVVLALLLANLFNLERISTMGSAGFLIIFAIVNAANYVQAAATGASRWLAGLGVVACAGALVVLIWRTLQTGPAGVLILAGMVGLAALSEFLYIKFLKHPDQVERVSLQRRS